MRGLVGGLRPRRVGAVEGVLLVSLLLVLLVFTGSASASFGFSAPVVFSANEAPPAGSAAGVLGPVDRRAGSHPYSLTTQFVLNATTNFLGEEVPDGALKDVQVETPAGLVGNATIIPRCSAETFTTERLVPFHAYNISSCPAGAAVGVAGVKIGASTRYVSIYNLVPPPGVPAEFGFDIANLPVLLVPSVRTRSDYGLTIKTENVNQILSIFGVTVTFWGVPGDSSHDGERGTCLNEFTGGPGASECSSGGTPAPLLTLPTSCATPFQAKVYADSWQHPGTLDSNGVPVAGDPNWQSSASEPVELEDCDGLDFRPSLTAAPETVQSDTPTGLSVEVKVPQEALLSPSGLAPADLRDTTVTLPEGLVVNPGQAAGLAACQSNETGIGTEAPASCPAASKVGSVEIETPLLNDTLKGSVFILQSNPPNLQLLLTASADGVNLKLVGNVTLNETTGRLTTTFQDTPQMPFTSFRLTFSGGAQAALVTPPHCGTYTTEALFVPWSSGASFPWGWSDSFNIEHAPGGAGCSAPLPFAPSLIAGATTDQAGQYTDFSLLLQRGDGQQRISSLQLKTPAGLLGMVGSVPLCGEPQAAQGTCPAASEIGHTVVAAGPGPDPLIIPEPGQPPAPIYLTGGYKGAPYGLSIVVPVIAGPFNLGTEVVRAAIAVDPHTAQLTITTDPLPSIIHGIPTDLRTINAVIDRPSFIFNPTNCNAASFSGSAHGSEGTTAAISNRFQVLSCRSLAFKPTFKVSTSGKTSRADGASLAVKLTYPKAAQGIYSNVAKVKVDLPKQLPSRLTTLQKACLAATFESNPAKCPPASLVGHATAITPVLSKPLTGPVYFVSHGGEAFPSLIIVLQGQGITVDLVGTTFISKAGITSSTFKSVPDVPINSFELTLPKGKNSALTANGNLCTTALKMPTAFTAQNGTEIHTTTTITTTNCPKKKNTKTPKKH